MPGKRTAAGIALLAASIAVAEESRFFPHGSDVVIFLVLVWAGLTFIVRSQRRRWTKARRSAASEHEWTAGRPVRIALVPNSSIAAVWLQRLHEAGIDAVMRHTSPRIFMAPVALFVGEEDVLRARELFPELREELASAP